MDSAENSTTSRPDDRLDWYASEVGPWRAGKTDDGRVYVESDDFAHDVRLYVDGDFRNDIQKLDYARMIAARLTEDHANGLG